MDLILCHQTADFDTLGAAVGLTRLHPGSRLVLTGNAHPGVRRFLALYRDELATLELRSVNERRIHSLTCVDAQVKARFGKAAAWMDLPLARLAIYDHHAGESDIPATERYVEPVGAASTLVVEHLEAAGVAPTPVEATAIALGIHADTGSLTYESTTHRDARALAWLLERGADRRAIATYLQPVLSEQLQTLLATALAHLQIETRSGVRVGWVLLRGDDFAPGLSRVAEQLTDFTDTDAFLLGHGAAGKLSLIGRSRLESVDLGAILGRYGGGGHALAASARVATDDPEATLEAVLDEIWTAVPRSPTARELMTAPVRTLRPDLSIGEAQRVLLRYGHGGLPVVDADGELVGVISRRDIDLALHHGFDHAPVRGYMSRNVKAIAPETLLPDIEATLVTYDIGRLPVLAAGKLVGIVSRTDILRHRGELQRDKRDRAATRLLPEFQRRLAPALWQLLERAAAAAGDRGWHIYLVGGAVRDLLLAEGETALHLEDLDLVVDGFHRAAETGAGVELAKGLLAAFPGAHLSIHGEFQTAALSWHDHPDLGTLLVDIATARTEFYPYPAANPEVEASSIRQDLYRRDFTINALALRLSNPDAGKLLDFFGGLLDLKARHVRVLHANSFIEDPTRIFRGARFATRLGFTFEAQTETYARMAIASLDRERLQPVPALQTRLKAELKYLLSSVPWRAGLKLLAHLGALRCLHPDLELTPLLWTQVLRANAYLRWLDRAGTHERWRVRLDALIAGLAPDARRAVAVQLQLPADSAKRLQELDPVREAIAAALRVPSAEERADLAAELNRQRQAICPEAAAFAPDAIAYRPSTLVATLQPYDLPLLLLVMARAEKPLRRQLWDYLTHWQHIRAPLSGNDLKAMGYRPGPQFRTLLDGLLAAHLDGVVRDRTDAERWLHLHA